MLCVLQVCQTIVLQSPAVHMAGTDCAYCLVCGTAVTWSGPASPVRNTVHYSLLCLQLCLFWAVYKIRADCVVLHFGLCSKLGLLTV